jgi:uncharacterized protein (TIGR03437 family)
VAYTTASSTLISTLARSTDSGATWTPISNIPEPTSLPNQPAPSVSVLAIDPENSQNLWIGVEAFPISYMIDKSTDGGNTWQIVFGATPVPPPFPFMPKEIFIDPTNSAHVYACCATGQTGGLYFTEDGGQSWTEGGTGPGSLLVLDPSNPFTLYAASYPVPIRSTDGGQTWNPISFPSIPQDLDNLLIDSAGLIYVIADAGDFLSGPNLGGTWTITTTHGPWALYSTLLAIDPARPDTVYVSSPQSQVQDAFAIKLDPSANVLWATLLGGSNTDSGSSIAVDAQGNAYVAGVTSSPDFPVVNAVQPTRDTSFPHAFVTEINASGSALVYSTYLGGSGEEGYVSLAVDPAGEVYVAGITESSDFPLVDPISSTWGQTDTDFGTASGFLTKFAANGTKLLFSTFLAAQPSVVAVDSTGSPWIAGIGSINLPLVNEIQASFIGGFIAQLNSAGTAYQFSSFFGCYSVFAIAPTPAGSMWIAGPPCPGDFPNIAPLSTNAGSFIARIDPAPPAAQLGVPRIDGVYNAGSFQLGNAIAPGEVVTLIGAQLAASAQTAATVPLPTSLSDVSISIAGTRAPLFYASPGQINFEVPTGLSLGIADMAVIRGANVTHRAVNLVSSVPGIFFVNGVPAVTHSKDFSLVTAANPATPGEYISVFCSGLGPTNPSVTAGQAAPLSLVPLQAQVVAVVGGRETPVQYSGLVPGSIGLYQVNFQLLPDTSLENTDLYIMIGTPRTSTNDVPLFVQ